MTVYTLGQMTNDALQKLRGTTREKVNIISQPLDAPAALTVEYVYFTGNLDGVVVGSLLSLADETMYVLSIDPVNIRASVIRGYDGTTPAVAAAGVLIYIDTPWPRALIQSEMRDEIRSWGPQVWTTGAVDIPIINMQRGYDLGAITTPIIRILAVTAPSPPYTGDPGYWSLPATTNISMLDPAVQYVYNANANPTEFPSGKSLTIISPAVPNYAGNLHVVYAKPFDVDTSWADSTDMIANVGMDSRDLDIPSLGTAARLLRWVSVRRSMLNVQGQSRSDQDVTMATILQGAQAFQLSTASRLKDVQLRLLSDWPIRQSNY